MQKPDDLGAKRKGSNVTRYFAVMAAALSIAFFYVGVAPMYNQGKPPSFEHAVHLLLYVPVAAIGINIAIALMFITPGLVYYILGHLIVKGKLPDSLIKRNGLTQFVMVGLILLVTFLGPDGFRHFGFWPLDLSGQTAVWVPDPRTPSGGTPSRSNSWASSIPFAGAEAFQSGRRLCPPSSD